MKTTKKEIEISYYYHSFFNDSSLEISKNIFPLIINNSKFKFDSPIDLCPPVSFYNTNTYIVRSPIDLCFTTKHEGDNNVICIEELNTQLFLDMTNSGFTNEFQAREYLTIEPNFKIKNHVIAQFILGLNLIIDVKNLNIILHDQTYVEGLQNIAGLFNIAQWNRSINFAFIIKENKKIKIKRGDPLFKFTLFVDDNSYVKLTEEQNIETIDNDKRIKKHFSINSVKNLKKYTKKILQGNDEFWNERVAERYRS